MPAPENETLYVLRAPTLVTVRVTVVLPGRPLIAIEAPLRLLGETTGMPALAQNFPNPFNPVTTISYDLPRETHVRLEILTPLGQSVEILVDRDELAGLHRLTWEAANRSSGVYFLKLTAEEFVQVRKMVVAK